LCRTESWRLGIWDCDSGLAFPVEEVPLPVNPNELADPLAVLRAASQLSTGASTTLLVFENFHKFLGSTEILQALSRQVSRGKHSRTFFVILAPTVSLPPEIEKQFIVVEHELPGHDQLRDIAAGISQGDELPSGKELSRVLDSAAGLTRYEAEGAFSLSIVRHGRLDPATIWDVKGQQLKKSGLVSLYRGHEGFDSLGGLDNLKAFCLRAMRQHGEGKGHASNRPRGVLLLSPPGCGKSQFAKALGNETGRPTLILDIGAVLGSLVGQSESNIRHALKLADAMAPCVLFCDEIEKALARATSSGQTDSGVTARVFGSLLTWLTTTRAMSSSSAPVTTPVGSPLSLPGQSVSTACSSWTCPAATKKMRSGVSIRGTMALIPSRPGPMTPTGLGLKSNPAADLRRSWMCRWFRPPRTSYPWL